MVKRYYISFYHWLLGCFALEGACSENSKRKNYIGL